MDRPVRFCYSFLLDANFHTGSVSIEEAEKIEYYYRNNISCAKGKIKNPNKHNSDDNESNSTTSFDFYFDNCSDYYQLYNYNEIYTLSLNALSKDSLLFFYKKLHWIDYFTFYKIYSEIFKRTSIYFGEVVSSYEYRAHPYYKCNIDRLYNKWGCHFETVCLDENCNDYYDNKYIVLFEPFIDFFIVPSHFMRVIAEKKFKKKFLTGKCRYKFLNAYSSLKFIDCDDEEISLKMLKEMGGKKFIRFCYCFLLFFD